MDLLIALIVIVVIIALIRKKRGIRTINTSSRTHTTHYVPVPQTRTGSEQPLSNAKDPEDPSHIKGKQFENFVISKFDLSFFDFKDARTDRYVNGVYPESNTYPDLLFQCKRGSRDKLAIECKFRSNWKMSENGSRYVRWSYKAQVERYKRYEMTQGAKVFVVLGLGGEPRNPREIFIVPLQYLAENEGYVFENFLGKFRSLSSQQNFFYDMRSKYLTQKTIQRYS